MAGYDVVCFDNLSESRPELMDQTAPIAGKPVPLIVGDVRDRPAIEEVMRQHDVDAVIHLAGLKAVGEAVSNPLTYYDNNVLGSLCLLEAMAERDVGTLVFASSATVYAPTVPASGRDASDRAGQSLRPHKADGRGGPGRQRRR